jgi:hypothetical protein
MLSQKGGGEAIYLVSATPTKLLIELLWNFTLPSCTSAGCVLQLSKVSYISNKQFSRSCTYKVHTLLPFRESISWIISPSKFWTATICMKEYGCCPKFKRGDNSNCTLMKRGCMYLVSATPTKLLIEFLLNFTQL